MAAEKQPIELLSRRDAATLSFLRRLTFAIKALQMYPLGSEVARNGLEKCREALADALSTGPLELLILPKAVRWRGLNDDTLANQFEQLGSHLHARGVARLRLLPEAEESALATLTRLLATRADETALRDAVEKLPTGALDGFEVHFIELGNVFDNDSGGPCAADHLWENIVTGFSGAAGGPPGSAPAWMAGLGNELEIDAAQITGTTSTDGGDGNGPGGYPGTGVPGGGDARPGNRWQQIAGDPESMRTFFEWITDRDALKGSVAGYSRADLVSLSLEKLGGAAVSNGPQTSNELSNMARDMFERLDPEAWIEILADPLAVEIDPEQASTALSTEEGEMSAEMANASTKLLGAIHASTIDMSQSAASSLSDAQVKELILYSLRNRERATPRLYRLFNRLLSSRPTRGEISREVMDTFLGGSEATNVEGLLESWPMISDALLGEDVSPYITRNYSSTLDQAVRSGAPRAYWDLDKTTPRLRELESQFLWRRRILVTRGLFERETEDSGYALLIGSLVEEFGSLIEHAEFALLEDVLSTIVCHAERDSRPKAQQQLAADALQRLREREALQALVEALSTGPDECFHLLWRIFEHLGECVMPVLIESLGHNPSSTARQRLRRIVTHSPRSFLDEVGRHLDGDDVNSTRSLIWLIGEVRLPECAELLTGAINNPDPGLRCEALNALAKIGGTRAEHALVRAVSDSSLEVHVAALRALAETFAMRSAADLLKHLEAPDWRGQNTRVLVAVLEAIASMGDPSVAAALRPLTRAPWLFRRRRLPVMEAARRALAACQEPRPKTTGSTTPGPEALPPEPPDKRFHLSVRRHMNEPNNNERAAA